MPTREENIKKLAELVADIEFAMLTTVDEDGSLRARPMAVPKNQFDGELWFFTKKDSPKVDEIEHEHQVNVSFARPDKQHYISMSGVATVSRDRKKMEELWNPAYMAWFPEGLDDPQICLLHVKVSQAEYWDTPNSVVVHLIGLAKAAVTGESYKPGENEKVTL
ncbi:MAG: pyridoxamine 5'-phosphate oxidase family protein [Acidobacteriota bacterium]|nr:pyridoxamine 5'-phosphate oxidase family protein [Acidobacteriota bacterium]